jgi:hypothetical protein
MIMDINPELCLKMREHTNFNNEENDDDNLSIDD